MAAITIGLNAWANFRVAKTAPKDAESFETFVSTFTFSNAQTVVGFDLTGDDRSIDFSLSSMFVDNSSPNSVPITFIFNGSGQRIVVKANTQGYFPIVASARDEAGSNIQGTASAPTAGAQPFQVQVMFLNYMVDPSVWPTV